MRAPKIDLHATTQNTQLPLFCSRFWERVAMTTDGLSFSWSNSLMYVYPSMPLIPAVLRKTRRDKATLIPVAPYWAKRFWFSEILEIAEEGPVHLPVSRDVLSQNKGRMLHNNPSWIRLAAWRLNGKN